MALEVSEDPGEQVALLLLKNFPKWAIEVEDGSLRILKTWLSFWPTERPSDHPFGPIFWSQKAPSNSFQWEQIHFLRQVMSFNQNRPKTEVPPYTSATDAEPASNGYVPKPVDLTAYVQQSEILASHTPLTFPISEKQLPKILECYLENKIRWTRPLTKTGMPNPQRRLVHLNDWCAYLKRIDNSVPSPNEIADRKAKIRAARSLRGK